ncbi:MAG: DOMON-like domain-containing protein [Sphingopyxis sp.]|uniref:DOMON-like domain-containing protein n=1 Tax=Sphingopyxis sp. TaxID=1908224 RepID=UPI002ABD0F66|nr:DOMON-like domain-containing protein [Sphingopyxis sp.]MDZ3831751.1 DOMON-like domain-containing protein [Sphingopyxis sp.]
MRAELICHPDTPAVAVRSVAVDVELSFEDGFALRFMVEGDIDALLLPQGEGELVIADAATDGLWQSSCFEAFLTDAGEPDYTEFNYAPDGRWACYQFDDYRALLHPDELAPWVMAAEKGADHYALRVEPGIFPEEDSKLALSAVIEERDGTKSYWALHHPPGKPDFHHPDCFRLALGAPPAP